MRKILVFLVIIFCFNVAGCGPKMAPGIVYENVSRNGGVVKNIEVKWNKYYLPKASNLNFCGVDSSGYNIDTYSSFFGPIHIEWENAKGQKLTKDFVFTEDQLPNMRKSRPSLSSVKLYFTQDNVYLYTSDTANLKQIENDLYKKAGLTCQEYRDQQYIKKWGKDW